MTVPNTDRDWQQRGIYAGPGEKPPNYFGIMFVNVSLIDVRALDNIPALLDMYANIRNGIVADLGSKYRVPATEFDVLLGFSREISLRYLDSRPETRGLINKYWPEHAKFLDDASPGQPVAQGTGLKFGDWTRPSKQRRRRPRYPLNPAASHAMIQFHSDDLFAIHRAIIETWKFVANRAYELSVVGAYTGVLRDDGRGWLDFHDGVANVAPTDRPSVIHISSNDGLDGATFMCFMRLPIRIDLWTRYFPFRQLDWRDQEVGRRMRSGVALRDGDIEEPSNMPPGWEITHKELAAWRDSPSDIRSGSHARFARDATVSGRRVQIYRQGYEFLDSEFAEYIPSGDFGKIAARSRFRVGLNFVSFQRSPEYVFAMLANMPTSFSAHSDDERDYKGDRIPLVTAESAGMYVVPSKEALDVWLQAWRTGTRGPYQP